MLTGAAFYIRRVGNGLRDEDKGAWKIAHGAAHIINSHLPERAKGMNVRVFDSDGAEELCQQYGGRPDRFENKAIAELLFVWLHTQGFGHAARVSRRELYISKWEAVAEKWRQYNLDAADCFSLLRDAIEESPEEIRTKIDRSQGVDILARKIAGFGRKVETQRLEMWAEVDRRRDIKPASDVYRMLKKIDIKSRQLSRLVDRYGELQKEG